MIIYDGTYDKKILPTDHTISVVSTNKIICNSNDFMTIRKNGRCDWSIFYCESGKIYINDTVISAGQLWIYPPFEPQKYIWHSNDKTVYHYLHFTGSNVSTLLDSLEIPVLSVINIESTIISDIFDLIQNDLLDDSALSKLSAEYHALRLLSKIAPKKPISSEEQMLKRITDNMEHSFCEPYDASTYAKMLSLSESRFNHLFKELIGVSPYCYYTSLRISNACTLLSDTDLKIQEISECCGYTDPLYFTRNFKKRIGMTPTLYRKKYNSKFY